MWLVAGSIVPGEPVLIPILRNWYIKGHGIQCPKENYKIRCCLIILSITYLSCFFVCLFCFCFVLVFNQVSKWL